MVPHNIHIAAMGFEEKICDIAENGYSRKGCVETAVANHARHSSWWQAKFMTKISHVETNGATCQIAHDMDL
jgi:hypothetical protein